MRFVGAMMALAALTLSACTTEEDQRRDGAPDAIGDATSALGGTASAFDYRFAYRLPAGRVKDVLESNAAACDRLGPGRCRILSMRYRVDDDDRIAAMLTFTIDPAIARDFGAAATKVVTSVDGMLIDTEIAGAGTTASARSNALVERLRNQVANAEARVANDVDPAERAQAQARLDRLRNALETITEVETGQGQSYANAPVLITYSSGDTTAAAGTGNGTLGGAGKRLEGSLAEMAELLAGVGPWLVLMAVGVLVLRWFIHGSVTPEAETQAVPAARPVAAQDEENSNMLQRWFSHRNEEEEA